MRIHPQELIVEQEPDDLADLDMADLRSWRERLQTVEYGYSYARRVTQGRLDTLLGELERRRSGGEVTDLMESITTTLGNRISGPGLPRPTRGLDPPEGAHELVAELDDIMGPSQLASLHDVDLEALADAAQQISTLEHDLSQARGTLHKRIDRVQAELISRYRDGAGVEDLLS